MSIKYNIKTALVPSTEALRSSPSSARYLDVFNSIVPSGTNRIDYLERIVNKKPVFLHDGKSTITCRETLINDLLRLSPYMKVALDVGNSVLVSIKCSGSRDGMAADYFLSLPKDDQIKVEKALSNYMFNDDDKLSFDASDDGTSITLSFRVPEGISWLRLSGVLLALRVLPDLNWKKPRQSLSEYMIEYAKTIPKDSEYDEQGTSRVEYLSTAIMPYVFGYTSLLWSQSVNGPYTLVALDRLSVSFWRSIRQNTGKAMFAKFFDALIDMSSSCLSLRLYLKEEGFI